MRMRNKIAWACAGLALGGFAFGQQPQKAPTAAAKSTAPQELTNLLDAKIKAEWQAIKDKD